VNSTRVATAASFLVCLVAGRAGAQPEPWQHPDGTIHYYDALAAPGGVTWDAARALALDSGGYLATLTSQAENDFVFGLLDSSSYWYQRPGSGLWAGPWFGGFQPPGSPEPDSGWRWVTDETMSFDNWSPGEPDNEGDENALHFGESVSGRVPTWNDRSSLDDSIRGFVRELSADSTTIGLLQNDSAAFIGYTLFAPLMSNFTYLIDNKGRLVHSWRSSFRPGLSAYLLENGNLLRTANVGNMAFGGGGRVEEFDWGGNFIWAFNYSTDLYCQHHDIEPLPNGNVLMIAWEYKTRAEASAAGRDPAKLGPSLWPDHVIEVNPANDSIVWEWHVWDHLIQDFDPTKANYEVVADHPELVDINFVAPDEPVYGPDWNHVNAIYYNEQFDQVTLSVHGFSEVWVIDHSTTTEQARGHSGGRQGMGGDILYRWGNPQTYRAGDSTDQKFFGQHDARWIEPGLPGVGHITVFNNGLGRPGGEYSTVDEFIPACDSTGAYPRPLPGTRFGPDSQCWVYCATPPTSLYSSCMSGAQRLPDGHTLVCTSEDGTFREVTSDSQVVWRYVNPVIEAGPLYQGDSADGLNQVFRATRYEPDYPGLAGRNLTPGYPVERYRVPFPGVSESGSARAAAAGLQVSPNPFGRQTTIRLSLPRGASAELGIYDITGKLVYSSFGLGNSSFRLDLRSMPAGVYYCRLQGPGFSASRKLVKAE
jgi:hypothetical protein